MVSGRSEPQFRCIWRLCHAQSLLSNHHLPLFSPLSEQNPVVMVIALSPSTAPQDSVIIDFLRRAFFLEKSKLQIPKLRTPEDVAAEVACLTEAIKTAIEKVSQVRLLVSKSKSTPDSTLFKIRKKNRIWKLSKTYTTASNTASSFNFLKQRILASRISSLKLRPTSDASGR